MDRQDSGRVLVTTGALLALFTVVAAVGIAAVVVREVATTPMRYCVVSESSVNETAPWRRPGAVGPEFDPHSGCFHGEYVVCVPYRDYEADAWNDGGDRSFASTECPSVGEDGRDDGDRSAMATVFCVVALETTDERGGPPLGEIVRADAADRCLDRETRVCGRFVPAAVEHESLGPDKTEAFHSARCP